MGRRGPKPTPKEKLKLRGSWRGNIPDEKFLIEPKRVRCPRWLSLEAQREWRKLSPILNRYGLLNELTVMWWSFYVTALADLKHIQAEIDRFMRIEGKKGLFPCSAEITKSQSMSLRRLISIRTDLMRQLISTLKEAGIAPEIVLPKKKPDNNKARFFNRFENQSINKNGPGDVA